MCKDRFFMENFSSQFVQFFIRENKNWESNRQKIYEFSMEHMMCSEK